MSVFTDPYQDSYPPGVYTVPVLSGIAPTTGVVNTSQTVTLNGSGFFTTTKGYVDGVAYPTTYVTPTQVRITWTPTSTGVKQVTARNGQVVSAQRAFTVTATGTGVSVPTAASTKGEIVAWLLDHGVSFTEEALMDLTKAELLDLVADLVDSD